MGPIYLLAMNFPIFRENFRIGRHKLHNQKCRLRHMGLLRLDFLHLWQNFKGVQSIWKKTVHACVSSKFTKQFKVTVLPNCKTYL